MISIRTDGEIGFLGSTGNIKIAPVIHSQAETIVCPRQVAREVNRGRSRIQLQHKTCAGVLDIHIGIGKLRTNYAGGCGQAQACRACNRHVAQGIYRDPRWNEIVRIRLEKVGRVCVGSRDDR